VCTTTCGDGIVAGAEACDDDDTDVGDGCSDTCTLESGWTCSGEPSVCATTCGDGIVAGAEACDDRGTAVGDGCSNTCTVEVGWSCNGSPSVCAPICGDGLITGGEACDDQGTAPGDGCSATCRIEVGWTCGGQPSACAPICGDGLVLGAEGCDDANLVPSDGCSDICAVELGWACTGQPSACASICGDGILRGTETCDDGWLSVMGATGAGGDGCSATCAIEGGYTCTGTPSICGRNVTYTGVPVPINDNATSNINMANATACSLRAVSSVSFRINHTYVGDLLAQLLLPGGVTTLALFDRPGVPPVFGNSNDLTGVYTFRADNPALPTVPEAAAMPAGSYAASDSAGARATWGGAGTTTAGTWTLRVSDLASADVGSYDTVTVAYTCQVN
jgi:cysteine-rich repeat protein